VPGDISSAAFFIAAALLVPESNLVIRNAGLNPTRTALLDLLAPLGGRIKVLNVEMINGELLGDLHVESSALEGGEVPPEAVPGLIDELPVLAVLGTQTERGLSFRGAQELRVKETDRIRALAENLRRMGAEVEEFPDGLRVAGKQRLRGAEIESYGDHRIAMAFAVAGLVAEGTTVIRDSGCVDISFPGFFDELERVTE
jgi:3-phosphoshikimate 1-carboxyvinyltransferase